MMNPIDINTARFNLQNSKVETLERFAKDAKSGNVKDEALKKAASDFEAVFITQLLNTMDSTVEKGDFMHGGQGEDIFKSMLNEHLSTEIASNPKSSFGLAEQIYNQMKDRV
jgi:peptidoglycan hydrolase FlgJ